MDAIVSARRADVVLLRVCVTPVHAAQSLVGCARSHLRREQPGGDANRGKNKGFSCEKERVCAALFYLSIIRFGTADGRGKILDRRRSVRLTLFCMISGGTRNVLVVSGGTAGSSSGKDVVSVVV